LAASSVCAKLRVLGDGGIAGAKVCAAKEKLVRQAA
jgi:hypothetical protein